MTRCDLHQGWARALARALQATAREGVQQGAQAAWNLSYLLSVTGTIALPDGTEMCMPGDNTPMTVELIAPIAMDEGLRFAIREGGRTVGAGAVTKVIK